MAAQAGLCLAWSETPEDMFSHDEAHVYLEMLDFLCMGIKVSNYKLNRYRRKNSTKIAYRKRVFRNVFKMQQRQPIKFFRPSPFFIIKSQALKYTIQFLVTLTRTNMILNFFPWVCCMFLRSNAMFNNNPSKRQDN